MYKQKCYSLSRRWQERTQSPDEVLYFPLDDRGRLERRTHNLDAAQIVRCEQAGRRNEAEVSTTRGDSHNQLCIADA
jgi:hypothetical protein